jgi:hypothetical protein
MKFPAKSKRFSAKIFIADGWAVLHIEKGFARSLRRIVEMESLWKGAKRWKTNSI